MIIYIQTVWEQCKLGDAVSVTMGQSPNGENYTENPNDNILVQGNADMQNGKVVPRVWTTQITKTAEPGDIILSVRAPVGDVGKTNFNVVLGRGVAGIKGNDYIYQYLIRMKEIGYWTRVSTGSTFESINSNDLKDAVINSPSQNEQYKIGEFFLKLDKTITLHQRKLEAMKQLKHAYLQQMFPSEGESVPSVRFTNFKINWEQRKLGDMVEFFSGLTYSPNSIVEQPGTLVLRSSNVQNGEIVNADNVYVNNEVVNSDNVQVGDIVVVVRNGSKSLIGKHAAIKFPMEDTVIGAFMTGVRSDTPTFTNALLDSKQFEIEIEKNLGATINQITTGNFKKMTFKFPAVDERLKIGECFNQFDNIITLHQHKLESLNKLKQAYLQKMLI